MIYRKLSDKIDILEKKLSVKNPVKVFDLDWLSLKYVKAGVLATGERQVLRDLTKALETGEISRATYYRHLAEIRKMFGIKWTKHKIKARFVWKLSRRNNS